MKVSHSRRMNIVNIAKLYVFDEILNPSLLKINKSTANTLHLFFVLEELTEKKKKSMQSSKYFKY